MNHKQENGPMFLFLPQKWMEVVLKERVEIKMQAFGCLDKTFQFTTVYKILVPEKYL